MPHATATLSCLLVTTALLTGCTKVHEPADSASTTAEGSSSGDVTDGTTDASASTTDAPTTGEPTTGEAAACPPQDLTPDPDVCPDGTLVGAVMLSTQADVERLRGCTRITDRLDIMGDDIVDLCPLAALTEVGTYFEIRLSPGLETLAGLEQLARVGAAIFITENAALHDLDGLSGLRHVHNVDVGGNPSLVSLAGLADLTAPAGSYPEVYIAVNDALTTLDGLEKFVTYDAMRVTLVSNPALVDLSALAGADVLAGLEISDNDALVSLAGLENLERVDGTAQIRGNAQLQDLSALAALHTVETLELAGNPALTGLSGLSGLQHVQYLELGDLGALTSLAGLDGLVEVHRLNLNESDSLTSLAGLPPLTLAALDLRGCDGLTSLAGLEDVTLGEQLWLSDNSALASLTGLTPPTSLYKVYLRDNDALTSLAPLDPVASLTDLTIINHAALLQTDAEAWAGQRTVSGTLKVAGNLGALPPQGPCPWVDDWECDEPLGTGLCLPGTDTADCQITD